MPPEMYLAILTYNEVAFNHDFNLIVEAGPFYHQLKPQDQSRLINLLFADFRRDFRKFFDPCDQGFTNEAIISLANRRWNLNERPQMVHRNGIKMNELFFIMQGGFGLCNKLANDNPKNLMPPFIVMGRHTTYGDYQLLFDLYPNMDFKTYIYDFRHKTVHDLLKKSD